MKNHSISITPLNASYSGGMNAFMRMEESEYTADTARSIYSKSPVDSWFKMKSGTQTPYLEPALFALRALDIVTVEFECLVLSGVTGMTVNLLNINSSGAQVAVDAREVPSSALKSFYKKFKVQFPISVNQIGAFANVLNIRPSVTSSELIVKNIVVSVETSNRNFSMVDNEVTFNNQSGYMKCINLYSGSDIKTSYSQIYDLYTAGNVLFPDADTIKFNAGTVGKFRGLMSLFPAGKYRNGSAMYIEYNTENSVLPAFYNDYFDSTGTRIGSQNGVQLTDTGGAWKKKIIYLPGIVTPYEYLFLDIGLTNAAPIYSFRNVHFASPRFDDTFKKRPNELDGLYKNLGVKLRMGAVVTTSTRPTNAPTGYWCIDSTLGKMIWWTGTAWKDAMGTTL